MAKRQTTKEVYRDFKKYIARAETNKTESSRNKNMKLAQKAYKKLAKSADVRLANLEALSEKEHFKGVLSFAYSDAKYDITKRFDNYSRRGKSNKILKNTQSDVPRFNRNMPTNIRGLQSKVNAIYDFMNKPTSTESRIVQIYQKRVDTFNKNYDTNLTWQEYANFWEGQQGELMRTKAFYSRENMKAIAEIAKMKGHEDEVLKKYLEAEESNRTFHVSKDEVIDNVVKNMLKDGLTFADLFLTPK